MQCLLHSPLRDSHMPATSNNGISPPGLSMDKCPRHQVIYMSPASSHVMCCCCSIHYNRIHPAYWRDRLLRVQSMGLNAIQVTHTGSAPVSLCSLGSAV